MLHLSTRYRYWIKSPSVSLLLGALLFGCTIDKPEQMGGVDLGSPAPDLAGINGADMSQPLRALRAQDVSILYPLPKTADISKMVWASTLGNSYGRFLPEELFKRIPDPLDPRPASSTKTTDTTAWYALRLTSLRLDPCFGSRGEVPQNQCRNQVRLVFQGIHGTLTGSAADDGAIHALYDMPRADLLTLTRELLLLTEREGGYDPEALSVHPVLKRQGYDGAFAQGVKDLLRKYLGVDRLVKMTFFIRGNTLMSSWRFGAFDRKGQVFERGNIATLENNIDQALLAGLPAFGELSASLTPEPMGQDKLTVLLNGGVARAVSEDDRKRAYAAALRIENPRLHTPDTTDCASCHSAQAARAYGEKSFGMVSAGHPDLYTDKGDLRLIPEAKVSLENLHAFGYLETEIGLSQRTVNESAAVAAELSALLR